MSGLSSAGSGIAESLRNVAERVARSTVQVRAGRSGAGSGVIWRTDGLIITNAHVARGKRLTVELTDGRDLRARIIDRDDARDLAALSVDGSDLPAAAVANSDSLRPGELVLAVGNPFGVVGAVTTGIVHAAGTSNGSRTRWIQADVRIAPGNSGGPLADAHGRVVGINSMIYGGLAIAVPSNTVARFLRGAQGRPRLGVIIEPVALRGPDHPTLGLLILEIAADSDAERSGMLPGDVVTGIGGRALRSPEDLPDALADAGAGAVLELSVLRQGALRQVLVSLRAIGASAAA